MNRGVTPGAENENPEAPAIRDRLLLFAAEGFGSGRVPFAPGTFGSLPGLLLAAGLGAAGGGPGLFLLTWFALFVVGIPLCTRAGHLRGRTDPGSVVWDEITAFPLIFAFHATDVPHLIAGFVLFRIFDITKPWPIRHAERLPAGLGVMLDDQIAAIDAALLLGLLRFLLG